MKDASATGRGDVGEALRWLRAPEWGLAAGILAVLALIYGLEPRHNFFSKYSQLTLVHQVALFGILSVGAAVVIISGGIDLSVGAVVALASVVVAQLITEWLPAAVALARAVVVKLLAEGLPAATDLAWAVVRKTIAEGLPAAMSRASVQPGPPSPTLIAAAIALTLLMGLAIGLLHASLINRLRLPPFIATLATMAGLRSLAMILSKNRSINVTSRGFRFLGSDPWYTVPIFAVVAVAAGVMTGRTVLGRHLYALGGNEMAARLSGLDTRRLKAVAYGLSGMLAALGGILFTGKSGQGQATMGVAYELYAITAAVVGGCRLVGGVGSIRGTVLGLILIQIVIKGTGLLPWGIDSTQVEGLVLGTVVVLAVAINQRFRARG
jgi:ribose/xylose/arabinose/galactoside ABC-type transport system permease subunit